MISPWRQLLSCRSTRHATRWAASALLLTASSCTAMQRSVSTGASDPFLESDTPAAVATTRTREDDDPGSASDRVLDRVLPAGYEAVAPSGAHAPRIVRTRAEARLPDCDVCPETCPDPRACPGSDPGAATCATSYPDEYLFDGGDHRSTLYLTDDQINGLQPEDTAASYVDECQKRRITASNCVAIYAPRFAAVTSISQPIVDVGGGRPTQAVASRTGVGLVNRVGTFAQHQRDATERLVTRVRGSGLKSDVATEGFDLPVASHSHVHTTTPFQEFAFLRTGQFKQADEPRLAVSIQSAVVWSRDQFPVIAAKTEGLTELKGRFQAQELAGRENRCNGRAKLRIVKLADQSAAQPGDIVTFTIRFDNIGDREVQDVVIVDSLTARLEYIEDSGTCDHKGVLFTQENEEGSLVLRWELDDPLPGQAGGVVTFQARVR